MLKYFSIATNELDTYLDYALMSIIAIYIYDATPYEMGTLGTCFALPFLLSSHFFGKLFDNGKLYQWRIVLFSINTVVMPIFILTGDIYGLYAAVLLKTCSRCGLNISNVKLNASDEDSKFFFEVYGYLINLSRVLVPIAIIFIYAWAGVWGVILLSSSLNLLSVLISAIALRLHTLSCCKRKITPPKSEEKFSFIKELRSDKGLFYLVTGYTVANFAFFLSSDMLGLFFKLAGESENSVSVIISLLGVGGIAGTKVASLLNNSLQPVVILLTSIMINTLAFFIFGFISPEQVTVHLYYGGIILVGMSSGMTFFAIKSGVREIIGYQNVGKATGMIQLLSSVVAITMPLIGGYIANLYSIELTFQLTSVILLILLIIFTYTFLHSNHEIDRSNPV